MLKRILKKALEIYFSIKTSLKCLLAQIFCEFVLVCELIKLVGVYLEFSSKRMLDGDSLIVLAALAIGAWIFNLCFIVFESEDVTIASRWLEPQNQLEHWLSKNLPSLSLGQLTLKVSKYLANIDLLELIDEIASDDVRKLGISLPEEDIREPLYPLVEGNALSESNNEIAEGTNSNRSCELSELDEEEPNHFFGEIPHGCNNCKYLYGKIIDGRLLVCGVHPYGLEDCPDFERISTIALTHKNCHLPNFYGVRTNMSIEDLKRAIAYLQILRAHLPKFETVEDSLFPDTGTELLVKLYDCKPIVSPNSFPIVATIPLGNNWENYAYSTERGLLNQRFASAGAKRAILEIMYSQAYIKASRNSCPVYRDFVLILELMLRGYYVPAEWGLKTPSGKPYTGEISGGDLDNEPDWV